MKTKCSSALKAIIIVAAWLVLIAYLPFGCGRGAEQAESDARQNSSAAGETSDAAALRNESAPNGIEGEVVEAMNSGGYTYILIQTEEEKVWAAGPPSEIEVGERVMIPAAMIMRDFHSKTLDRTFETIYFAESFRPAGGDNPHEAHTDSPGAMELSSGRTDSGHKKNASTISGTRTFVDRIVQNESIEKAPGGYTVEEIYARKKELAEKTVKVRGIVVKYSPAIMGTNWVHLQDGTGSETSYDLAVTTDAEVRFGDLITVEGVLTVDKDLGAGYYYEVIVEGCKLIPD